MKKIFITTAALLIACTLSAADLFVSPEGNDRNPGTKDSPKATLTAALRQARELRRLNDESVKGGITIHLEAGADLRRMGEELQKLDKAFLVLLICERIKSFLQGGGNLGELAFVSAFWREFAAAVILYLLEQTDPHHLYQ